MVWPVSSATILEEFLCEIFEIRISKFGISLILAVEKANVVLALRFDMDETPLNKHFFFSNKDRLVLRIRSVKKRRGRSTRRGGMRNIQVRELIFNGTGEALR